MLHGEHTRSAAPRIDISVGSRFHAFDLARELATHGMLRCLYTGYPAFAASKFGIPESQVSPVWTHEALNRLSAALWRVGLISRRWDHPLSRRFDGIVSRRLKSGGNIFVGWSSQCLTSIRVARDLGMKTVVERGSTHIQSQREVLLAELNATRLPVEIPNSRIVETELAEYSEADYICVPSHFALRSFVDRGVPAAKLVVNPYGVDLRAFDGSGRVEASSRSFRVIHVGRVSIRKGVHYLVAAAGMLPEVELWLVGAVDPGMTRLVSRLSRTRICGPVSQQQLPALYAAADVFCLLSLEEGLALVIAQAMSMGLPVIVTPNTGAEELVTDGVEGFIVPARDVDVVRQRLALLSHDTELRWQMGRNARRRIAQGYSWVDYGRRAIENYRRMIAV